MVFVVVVAGIASNGRVQTHVFTLKPHNNVGSLGVLFDYLPRWYIQGNDSETVGPKTSHRVPLFSKKQDF